MIPFRHHPFAHHAVCRDLSLISLNGSSSCALSISRTIDTFTVLRPRARGLLWVTVFSVFLRRRLRRRQHALTSRIFGDRVEIMGHGRLLVFYLLCGVAAALAQTITAPDSVVPMVGASGAIAGVMGAYFVLYPKSRIVTLIVLFFFFRVIEVPAIVFLGIWFVMQFVSGIGSIVTTTGGGSAGGVAVWAHVAGFVAGISGVIVFRRPERQRVEWWHDV